MLPLAKMPIHTLTKKRTNKMIMKIKTAVCLALTVGLLAGCASEKSEKSERHAHQQAKLMAEAKVSKSAAESIAFAKVPNGTIKEGELEKENGKLQWSFDIATPGSKDITEVNVDAITGDVISVQKESPESESKEAGEDEDRN
jgi:uncharacterized membrane protein YkoI